MDRESIIATRFVTIMNRIFTLPQWAVLIILVSVVLIVVTTTVILITLMARILHKSSLGVFEVEDTPNETTLKETESTLSDVGEGKAMDDTMRTRRSNSFAFQTHSTEESRVHPSELSLTEFNGRDQEDDNQNEIDGDDGTVFMYKVDNLRGKADIFLKMLNDMRKRAKELPEGSPEKKQYRKVMTDVTRLLYLLNKKASSLSIPPDGMELMSWSEKILDKYLASQIVVVNVMEKERMTDSRMLSGLTGASAEGIFMDKLDFLRDHSDVFLRMLNEMRRRLKEIQAESLTAQNYRKVTKDVTRLLELLNKRPTTVEMPADGLQLVTKSEQILERYLASQGITPHYQEATALDLSNQQDVTYF